MRLILDLTDDNNSVLDICTTFTIPQLDNHSAREKKTYYIWKQMDTLFEWCDT